MKILVLSQYYHPDITAGAFRISETVSYLEAFGNEVEVVTGFPHKSDNEHEIAKSPRVHRIHIPKTEDKGFWGYIYQYVSFFLKSIIKGYTVGRTQNPDIIWASSPPIFVGLAGWIVAKLLGAKLALDIRDIWPDSAVVAGQISGTGFLYKVAHRLEVFLYQRADVVSCVANPMKEYIQEYTHTPVEVIYNGVDVSLADQNTNGEEGGINEYKTSESATTLLYAGNIGHVQQLEILIDVSDEIDQKMLKNDWEIFFLGEGIRKGHLKKLVEEKDLNDVICFLNPVPKEEVFAYLRSADALFIHLQNSKVLELTIPSKVFDYMYANRPLLAGIQGEGKRIINSVKGNVTFKPGNKKDLVKAFLEMDDRITELKNVGNASKIRREYSRKSQAKKLNDVFEKITVL